MCNSNHIHSIQCILPPYMLEAISMRGDKKMCKMVASMVIHAESYRQARRGRLACLIIPTENTCHMPSHGGHCPPYAGKDMYLNT